MSPDADSGPQTIVRGTESRSIIEEKVTPCPTKRHSDAPSLAESADRVNQPGHLGAENLGRSPVFGPLRKGKSLLAGRLCKGNSLLAEQCKE